MSDQFNSNGFTGSLAGYKVFCNKEEKLADKFYASKDKESKRRHEFEMQKEADKLKVSMTQLNHEAKKDMMKHDEIMQELADKKDIEEQKLRDKRETDREAHERKVREIDYAHDAKLKEFDIRKDEIAKEHLRKTEEMHLSDSRERTKIAHKHEEVMTKIKDDFVLKTSKEDHRHEEEKSRIDIEKEKAKGEIDIKIKEIEFKSKESEQHHKEVIQSMHDKHELDMKKADEVMEKAKLDSEKDTDIRRKEHEAK